MSIERAHSIVGHDVRGDRPRDDFYPTPPEATEALLSVESFDGTIWEPACGDGAISRVLTDHDVISTDLVARGFGEDRIDFLMEYRLLAPNIITNPPYKLAQKFAEHALMLGSEKVALLLKLSFLEGVQRCKWLEKSPLKKVWVFRKRLTLLRPGMTKTGGGMITYAWFVWEKDYEGEPVVGWC